MFLSHLNPCFSAPHEKQRSGGEKKGGAEIALSHWNSCFLLPVKVLRSKKERSQTAVNPRFISVHGLLCGWFRFVELEPFGGRIPPLAGWLASVRNPENKLNEEINILGPASAVWFIKCQGISESIECKNAYFGEIIPNIQYAFKKPLVMSSSVMMWAYVSSHSGFFGRKNKP